MNIMDMIKELEEQRENNFKNYIEARKALDEFLSLMKEPNQFKAGDYVARNESGMKVMKFPNSKQAAVVLESYDEIKTDESKVPYNLEVLVATEPDDFRIYKMLSIHLKKLSTKQKASNVATIKPQKNK